MLTSQDDYFLIRSTAIHQHTEQRYIVIDVIEVLVFDAIAGWCCRPENVYVNKTIAGIGWKGCDGRVGRRNAAEKYISIVYPHICHLCHLAQLNNGGAWCVGSNIHHN